MEFIKQIMDIVPGEWFIFLNTVVPFIGKGLISIMAGVYLFDFSFWKIVFLCSLGTCLKAGYWFPIVYGAEKYFHNSNNYFARKAWPYLQKELEKAKSKHEFCCRLLEFFSLQHFQKWRQKMKIQKPGIYEIIKKTGLLFLIVVLEFVVLYAGVFGHTWKVFLISAILFFVYWSYGKRNNRNIVYFSLLVIPNIGAGILGGACLAYLYEVKFVRGLLVVALGSVLSTILITGFSIVFKPEMKIFWEKVF